MTFALTGLPVFISKLVVDTKDENEKAALAFKIQNILLVICLLIFAFYNLALGSSLKAWMITGWHL